MEETIHSVDLKNIKQRAFRSIMKFNQQAKKTLEDAHSILQKKKKQRWLGYLKFFKTKSCGLRVRFEALKEATEKRIKHKYILQWVQEYDNEWVVKEITTKRETRTKLAWFTELKREYTFSKICDKYLSEKTKVVMQV